ncbi:MAG: hypothetical protein EBR27_05360 [Betaproteobacteria bacterium]|nr:hypothetical protein [Betaproteobacteria bacterium]NBY72678.1 hypothetical protein [Betaproteobacteria bacterium]NDD12809.1 hypothetical protein [Betaproteobacteria bacterium]
MSSFLETLRVQRWDDHRYYHHSRINQSLHLISALSFLASYVMLFINPAIAALMAWLVSMTSRQAGHFFFEPKGYDHINQATNEYKEEIKVGYNIKRKIVLMAIWAASPVFVYLEPDLFGLVEAHTNLYEFMINVGWVWLFIGVGGLVFRVFQLYVQQDLRTGLVWAIKIITDPFHDVKLYCKSPLYLLKGELIDQSNLESRHV